MATAGLIGAPEFAASMRATGLEIVRWAVAKKWRQACPGCRGCGAIDEEVCADCGGLRTCDQRPFAEEAINTVEEIVEASRLMRRREFDDPDPECPGFRKGEIELADAVIRLLDIATVRGIDLGAAVEAKMKFNWTRPDRHGGKAY